MIPKLQPDRHADGTLDVLTTLNALDDQLSYTLHKIRGVATCAALASRIDAPRRSIEERKAQVATATGSEESVLQLVDTINQLRCELLGELTRIACLEGRDTKWPEMFFRPPSPARTSVAKPAHVSRGPASAQDWIYVANDRVSDAIAMKNGKRLLGSIYMAGYAIECSLKALLCGRGDAFPSSGGAGHDLSALWKASGFQLRNLNDTNGAKAYFIEKWCTDLRYDLDLMDTDLDVSELLDGAGALVGYIQNRVKRVRGHR